MVISKAMFDLRQNKGTVGSKYSQELISKSKIGDKSYLEINPDYDNIIITGRVRENTEVGLSDVFYFSVCMNFIARIVCLAQAILPTSLRELQCKNFI